MEDEIMELMEEGMTEQDAIATLQDRAEAKWEAHQEDLGRDQILDEETLTDTDEINN